MSKDAEMEDKQKTLLGSGSTTYQLPIQIQIQESNREVQTKSLA